MGNMTVRLQYPLGAPLIRRHWRNLFVAITIVADSIAVLTSGVLAHYVRIHLFGLKPLPFVTMATLVGVFGLILLGFGVLFGLYRSAFHISIRKQHLLAGKTYINSILTSLAALYLSDPTMPTRRFTVIFFALLPTLFLIFRSLLNWLNESLQKKGYGVYPVLIVGYDNGGVAVYNRFKGLPELGYEVKALITREGNGSGLNTDNGPHLKIHHYSDLPHILSRDGIARVFIPSAKFSMDGYHEVITLCRLHRVKLKVLSPEADQLLRIANINDVAGITLYAPPRKRIEFVRRVLKRTFDIFASGLLLFILSPLFMLTGLAILIESGWPIFFGQERASVKGGKIFYFLKFRSMVQNAEELKESLIDRNESNGALFKMKDDPRLTRVGRFIRRYSIDELPQLINVFKGDMSLVGPRPLPIRDFDRVDEDDRFWEAIKDRANVRPGMTGLWQISGRSNIGFREMVLLDLYYVEHHSLLFDLEILMGTLPVVLFGKGAY